MKTITNISNLKKMVVTIASAMVLTTAAFASSTPGSEEMVSAKRLDAMMKASEQSIRFVAPAIEESQDVFYAMEELNTLAETTEASVKYVAPAVEEESVNAETESLDALAQTIEASVKYVAPAVEETEEVATAIEGLDKLAADTEIAVAFRAPRTAGSIENGTFENQSANVMLAVQTK